MSVRLLMSLRVFHVFYIALLSTPVRADTYRLTLPPDAPAPVKFGAEDLGRALAQAGHRPSGGRGGVAITVAIGGAPGPEAFAIRRRGTGVRVVGGDAVGAMYGLLEVAEQVQEAEGRTLRQALRPAVGRPYLLVRADSPTLALGSRGELPPILDDRAFWREYVAELARGRFNVLHLHGFLDPNTGASVSLLQRLAPVAGPPDPEARRALRALADLALHCRRHGVRLAITDDAAHAAPNAADSARRLLLAVPGLWGLGVRTGESEAPELRAALARVVTPPRQLLTWPDDVSSGTADRRAARGLLVLPFNAGSFGLPYPVFRPEDAQQTKARFFLWEMPAGRVAPFLPWWDPAFIRQAVRAAALRPLLDNRVKGILVEPPASIFASLPDPPRPLPFWWWHRTWGRLAYDPAEPDRRLEARFQRRYGREAGGRIARTLARASAIVPLIAATRADGSVPEREPGHLEAWASAPSLDPHALADVRTWAEQRLHGSGDGRLDPVQVSFRLAETAMRLRGEVDTISLLKPRRPQEWRELRRRIEALCHLADFASRRLSAAVHLEMHRRTGDEMELEHVAGQAPMAAASWAAMQRLLAPGGEREIGRFAAVNQPGASPHAGTVEPAAAPPPAGGSGEGSSMPSPAEGAPAPVASAGGAVLTPLEAAAPSAAAPIEEGPFAADADAIAALRADLSRQLGVEPPLPETLTVREAAVPLSPPAVETLPQTARPFIAHVPTLRGTPTRSLRINATVGTRAGEPQVTLLYRLVRPAADPAEKSPEPDPALPVGAEPERVLRMTRLFATQAFYQAEIPGREMAEGFLEYRIRAVDGPDSATAWPGAAAWRRVPVTRDATGPAIRPLGPARLLPSQNGAGRVGGEVGDALLIPTPPLTRLSAADGERSIILNCAAVDPAGVERVRLWVRPLSSEEPWQALDMTTDGDRYLVQVSLTEAGLQYSFEATDTWGNRSRAPDLTTTTPYLLLLP